jgi:hypothetical protein
MIAVKSALPLRAQTNIDQEHASNCHRCLHLLLSAVEARLEASRSSITKGQGLGVQGTSMSIEDCERAYAIAKGRAEDQYAAIRSLWRRLDELAPNLDNERKEI